MPIVDVDYIGTPPADLAQRLADEVGAALGAAPGHTWVRMRRLAPTDYAESGATDTANAPVFVTLLLATWPQAAQIEPVLQRVGVVVARACQLPPDHVHVQLAPPAAGRQAFGGNLVR